MIYRALAPVLILLGTVAVAAAQQPAPTSLPVSEPIPRAILNQMYQSELGAQYTPAIAERIYRAHELIERYFSQPAERQPIAQQLGATGLDANLLGRLARIRMDWPALQPGVYYINERVGPHPVRYFLGIPAAYDRAKPWPLVIKLPTADAFVTEPRPDPVRVNEIYTGWMSDELTRHPDAIVIMPLLHLDELWGPSYAGMNNVIQPMLHAAGRANIDPARVYMVGHSMSAHAAWNLALHYPTYFAAFNALAGSASADWQRVRAMNLRNVLPVVWHDADDSVIKVDLARQIIRIMRTQRVEVEFEETKGVGHVPSQQIADAMYAKMRARSRALYPNAVAVQSTRPDTMFNRNDWLQVYQPTRPGKEQRLYFARGSGHMVVHEAAWTAEASIQQNQITVNARNIDTLRIYVNDQMIDYGRAVSVVVNRRPRFEAFVRPNVEQMLKDQLFLGRGWRYYTGIIDIDLAAGAATQP